MIELKILTKWIELNVYCTKRWGPLNQQHHSKTNKNPNRVTTTNVYRTVNALILKGDLPLNAVMGEGVHTEAILHTAAAATARPTPSSSMHGLVVRLVGTPRARHHPQQNRPASANHHQSSNTAPGPIETRTEVRPRAQETKHPTEHLPTTRD